MYRSTFCIPKHEFEKSGPASRPAVLHIGKLPPWREDSMDPRAVLNDMEK
jgi:hypothetical protein